MSVLTTTYFIENKLALEKTGPTIVLINDNKNNNNNSNNNIIIIQNV